MPVDGTTWPPDPPTPADADTPRCGRCGAPVSHAFRRQWADNSGTLDACPQCLPRSVRWGLDIYDRDPDEVAEEYDRERAGAGNSPAPSSRQQDSGSSGTETVPDAPERTLTGDARRAPRDVE